MGIRWNHTVYKYPWTSLIAYYITKPEGRSNLMKSDLDKDIMVSVYCATYNHEKYIVKALDSILMQKVNFSLEILVGEDCSTDNTRAVLKKYESQHPGRVTVFYRDHNMNKEPIKNARDLKMRCRGKYVIALEGDDYWTDVNKLQIEVDFLEAHPEYIAVAHNCIVVDADSKPTGEQFPECKEEEYTFAHYTTGIMPGQTTTVLTRNYYRDHILDTSFVDLSIMPGDRRLYFTLLSNGRVYCIQKAMSAYRHITNGGASYSANLTRNYHKSLEWYTAQLEYAVKINNPDAIKCAELLYCLTVRDAMKRKEIKISEGLKLIKKIKNKYRTFFLMGKRDINRFILHKKLDI